MTDAPDFDREVRALLNEALHGRLRGEHRDLPRARLNEDIGMSSLELITFIALCQAKLGLNLLSDPVALSAASTFGDVLALLDGLSERTS